MRCSCDVLSTIHLSRLPQSAAWAANALEHIWCEPHQMRSVCPHFVLFAGTNQCQSCQKPVRPEGYIQLKQWLYRTEGKRQTTSELEQEVTEGDKVVLLLDMDYTFSAPMEVSMQDVWRTPNQNNQEQSIKSKDDTLAVRWMYEQCDSYEMYARRLQAVRGNTFRVYLGENLFQVELRPGFLPFLARNMEKLIIFVSTMATYEYAIKVIQLIDPHFKFVRKLVARDPRVSTEDLSNEMQMKSLDYFFQNSKILRSRSIIFDDQSLPWQERDANCFLKSTLFLPKVAQKEQTIPDSLLQSFCPQRAQFFVQKPTEFETHLKTGLKKLCEQLEEFQFLSLENLIEEIRILARKKPIGLPHVNSLASIREKLQNARNGGIVQIQPQIDFNLAVLRQNVLKGCRFFVEQSIKEIGGIRRVNLNDFRVQTILQHGGQVSDVLDETVTHKIPKNILFNDLTQATIDLFQENEQLIQNLTAKLDKTVKNKQIELLTFKERSDIMPKELTDKFFQAQKYWIVDNGFLFTSAYMLQRQPEVWYLINFVTQSQKNRQIK